MPLGIPLARHLFLRAATDAGRGHIGVIPLILIALAVLAVYAVVVLAHPMPRCPKCKGQRVVLKRKRFGNGQRPVTCRRCRGSGRAPWRGARLIHRAFWGAFGGPIRERLKGGHDESA